MWEATLFELGFKLLAKDWRDIGHGVDASAEGIDIHH